MLFHTTEFIFFFLPFTLGVFYALGYIHGKSAIAWLALASLFFYGWWEPYYVALIGGSIGVNYLGSVAIGISTDRQRKRIVRCIFIFLVLSNLLVLAYFKYLMFFAAQARSLIGVDWDPGAILLPIGISFYTFTQIAYIADCAAGKVCERSFISYVLFVTYFPHLVAGPVLHHAEMMPQFAEAKTLRFNVNNFAAGVTFFTFGLFKKIVFADGCAPLANQAFDPAAIGTLGMADAWIGVTAYMCQIYYDFSGYSDMAVGLSLMFNVKLPINFYSPYRATNIIDFWRRWHMTLSRFLRDYVYIPLGGNRNGEVRRYIYLTTTMVLGGLWHGASWTFIVWGTLHGVFLIINHGWRYLVADVSALARPAWPIRLVYWALTLIAVLCAWVYFRAPDVPTAHSVFFSLIRGSASSEHATPDTFLFLGFVSLLALVAPNSNQLMGYSFKGESIANNIPLPKLKWRPSIPWAIAIAGLLLTTIAFGISGRTKIEFLYFQF